MIVDYIKGDITETELPAIAHGCNCQNVMGSGVAKALFTKWQQVKTSYHSFCRSKHVDDLLGEVGVVDLKDRQILFNCFTQFYYGYDNVRRVNYSALAKCFITLNDSLRDSNLDNKLAIPKIGCGLAGGDWDIVKELIDDATPDIEVYVYEL